MRLGEVVEGLAGERCHAKETTVCSAKQQETTDQF